MHKKGSSKKHRMTRRKHRGGFYGAKGAIPGAPGAMEWGRGSEMGNWAVSSRGGNTQYGSGRRKSRGKKLTRRRKHRGGGSFGGVSASFQGSGVRGMANYVPTVTRDGSGSAAGGAFNNFGAQPGSGFSSFVKSA
jgi:hypothetical protein